MRIWRYSHDWSTADSAETDSGCFVGVAIAPDSEEAYVKVDGVLLQSGRVLALPSHGGAYKIERVHGPDTEKGKLTSIKKLSLMLFEHGDELGGCVTRANHRYSKRMVGDFS